MGCRDGVGVGGIRRREDFGSSGEGKGLTSLRPKSLLRKVADPGVESRVEAVVPSAAIFCLVLS